MSTSEAPMPLPQALVVCDQASPMPAVASAALRTLRGELLPHVGYEKFVDEYWRRRRRSDPGVSTAGDGYHDELRDLFIMAVGLGGEAGEVQELLKKGVRDGNIDRRALALELGDVLYYLTKIAHYHGLTLATLKRLNREKLEARRAGGKSAYTADHVVLDQPTVDWAAIVAALPPDVAKALRRSADFIEGGNEDASVIDEAEAARLASVLRGLAAAGEARVAQVFVAAGAPAEGRGDG